MKIRTLTGTLTGRDIITAKERITVFMRRRRTVRLSVRRWIQRMVDVGTIRRVV